MLLFAIDLHHLCQRSNGRLTEFRRLLRHIRCCVRGTPSLPYRDIGEYIIGIHAALTYHNIRGKDKRDYIRICKNLYLLICSGNGKRRRTFVYPERLYIVWIAFCCRWDNLLIDIPGKREPRPLCRIPFKEGRILVSGLFPCQCVTKGMEFVRMHLFEIKRLLQFGTVLMPMTSAFTESTLMVETSYQYIQRNDGLPVVVSTGVLDNPAIHIHRSLLAVRCKLSCNIDDIINRHSTDTGPLRQTP
ncbi:hypothetical protein BMS3Bbin07_00237 [bacterium BMS3Bbin07]|nr:hypothetical protein BMS3Bbin07_00237 [bacterium BMS3Bbin07]